MKNTTILPQATINLRPFLSCPIHKILPKGGAVCRVQSLEGGRILINPSLRTLLIAASVKGVSASTLIQSALACLNTKVWQVLSRKFSKQMSFKTIPQITTKTSVDKSKAWSAIVVIIVKISKLSNIRSKIHWCTNLWPELAIHRWPSSVRLSKGTLYILQLQTQWCPQRVKSR